MKGRHKIIIQDKRVRYEFEIKRNITIIRGDSATGKTQMVEMLAAYDRNRDESGVDVICDKNCAVLTAERWMATLGTISDSIVFIDEGARFTASDDFARTIAATDNYYVIVTREALPNLPYSAEEIYGIRTSDRYSGIKQVYHEFYKIYADTLCDSSGSEPVVITEDSNSGNDFFDSLCNKRDIVCLSAHGKSNVAEMVRERKDKNTVVIADGAAFGSEMERIFRLIQNGASVLLYLPESFEWVIINAGIADIKDAEAVLETPEDYIESSKYFSWERFFTEYLVSATKDDPIRRYSKSRLSDFYLQGQNQEDIFSVLPEKLKEIWMGNRE